MHKFIKLSLLLSASYLTTQSHAKSIHFEAEQSHNLSNIELITQFYRAFQNMDAEGMAACYHDDVVFYDPAFGELKGDRAKSMWLMLCRDGGDLKVQFSGVSAMDKGGSAHWEAWYKFSPTGRSVHNQIDAQFKFKDGKIIEHRDDFDLQQWSGQAMGLLGRLLGDTRFFQKVLQKQTNKVLDKFIEEQREK